MDVNATVDPTADETVDKTDPMFCCSMCLIEFNDDTCIPKLLTCHHSCCLTCLEKLVTNRNEIACPTCRQVTYVPSGARALTTNFYLSGFRDYVTRKYPNEQPTPAVETEKRERIWCKRCRDLAVKSCLGHEMSDYDAYVDDLEEKCRVRREEATENNGRLLNMKEAVDEILRAIEKLCIQLKEVADTNGRHLPLLQEENVGELDDAADENNLFDALGRLENLEACLKPFMEKTWSVWNMVSRCKVSITMRDENGVQIGEAVDFQLRRNTDNANNANDEEMTVLRYLLVVIFCRRREPNFKIIPLPNPNEPQRNGTTTTTTATAEGGGADSDSAIPTLTPTLTPNPNPLRLRSDYDYDSD